MYYFLISVILLSCTLGPLQTMDTMYVLLPIAVQFISILIITRGREIFISISFTFIFRTFSANFVGSRTQLRERLDLIFKNFSVSFEMHSCS